MNISLVLASQSPRRHELLAQLGYQFSCLPADIDETHLSNESPENYVCRLVDFQVLDFLILKLSIC